MEYRFYIFFAVLQATVMVVAMVTASKIIPLGPLAISAANVIFPLAYILGDVVCEVYGFRACRRMIWLGFGAMFIATLVFQAAVALPAIDAWNSQDAFALVLAQTPRIFIASSIAYLTGEWVNSVMVSKMKRASAGRYLWWRLVASSVAAQLLDSTLFTIIAFAGVFENQLVVTIIFSEAAVKLAIECMLLPISILVIRKVKAIEATDVIDRNESYRLFSL